MLINLRNALMAGRRLPYDAEVEYAYFDTSSIDTGIDYFPDFRILAGTNGNVRNVTIRCDDNHLLERMSPTTPYWSIVAGDTSGSRITTDIPVSGVHFIELYNGSVKADGASYGTIPNRTWASGVRCRIPRDANTYQFYLYSAKLYDESHNLVRDYIPVRVSVNGAAVGALYDRANPHGGPNRNGLYFSSLNPLVCGPDVVPVEYIESHGTEYIDTGMDAQSCEIRCDFDLGSVNTYETVFGVQSPANNFLEARRYANNTSSLQVAARNLTTTVALQSGRNSFVGTWDSSGCSGTLNGTAFFISSGAVVGTSGYHIFLFAANQDKSPAYYMSGKIYSFEMANNGTPFYKPVPVRVGTEGAMMDTLTRRIYRNAGTGAFTFGNDLRYPIPAA